MTSAREQVILGAAETIRPALGGAVPDVAIVLGSGLGELAERVGNAVRIPYAAIPGFHQPTVAGHKGELVFGTMTGKTVLVQSGRFHMYEGLSADTTALPVRVFATLGIRTVVLTNAAGGIRRTYGPGTIMLIADHLNLTGQNPLVGSALAGEERFPDLNNGYDVGLRRLARRVAVAVGIDLEAGVYAGLLGPSYETPAEIRMLERLGADAVGMSTVIEAIAARARGVRCLGLSTITNPAAGTSAAPPTHAEVMKVAAQTCGRVARLIEAIVAQL